MKTTPILVALAVIAALIIIQMVSGNDTETNTSLGRLESSQQDLAQSLEKMNSRVNKLQRGVNELKSAAIEQQNQIYLTSMAMEEEDISETSTETDTDAAAATIQQLQTQLAEMNEAMDSLNQQLSSTRRTMNRQTMFDTWENMQNPEVMTKNLNTFAAEYSKRIEDPIQKSEFEQDIERLNQMVGKIDDPDLYSYVYNRLVSQLEQTTDERRRERLIRAMESLENAENDEELQQRLTRYATFDNMRELSNIANKYDIPNSTLSEYGLSVMRRGGRRRP